MVYGFTQIGQKHNFPSLLRKKPVSDDYFQDKVVTNTLIYTYNTSMKISQINYYKTGHFDVVIIPFLAQFHNEIVLSSQGEISS
jgi:hypothetical protein